MMNKKPILALSCIISMQLFASNAGTQGTTTPGEDFTARRNAQITAQLVTTRGNDQMEGPLYKAVLMGNNAVVRALLQKGENVCQRCVGGWDLFDTALSQMKIHDMHKMHIPGRTTLEECKNRIIPLGDPRGDILHSLVLYGAPITAKLNNPAFANYREVLINARKEYLQTVFNTLYNDQNLPKDLVNLITGGFVTRVTQEETSTFPQIVPNV